MVGEAEVTRSRLWRVAGQPGLSLCYKLVLTACSYSIRGRRKTTQTTTVLSCGKAHCATCTARHLD